MVDALLEALLRANLAAAAAVLAVAALRKPARKAFGARVAYALWAVVPLAVAASLAPRPEAATVLSPFVLTAAQAAGQAVPEPLTTEPAALVLFGAWIGGALAWAGMLVRRQARFLRSLGRLEPLSGGVLRAESAAVGPAVVGAFRPRIVAPADFEARFAPAEREVILAHERVHLACGDAAINAFAAAAQCAAWFNPLVHLGCRLMRIDQELACDAAVLARFPAARKTYAEALLKSQLATQPLPLGCHWPAGADHPLKERILMLKSPLPARARRLAGLAAVAALGVGAAAAAWAAQPTPGPLIEQPDWIERPTGEDLVQYYPAQAAAERVDGRALIACQVAATGRLDGCSVVMEDPAQYGFGAAALQLAQHFQMRPMSKDGVPVSGGRVRIPIRFMLPKPAPAPQ